MNVVITICIILMAVAMLLVSYRFVKGPSIVDRLTALDLMSYYLISIIVLYSCASEEAILLDAAVILALIAFLGTLAFAYYLLDKVEL